MKNIFLFAVLFLVSLNVNASKNYICVPEQGVSLMLMDPVEGWEGGAHAPALGNIIISKTSGDVWSVKKIGEKNNFLQCNMNDLKLFRRLVICRTKYVSTKYQTIVFEPESLRFSYSELGGYILSNDYVMPSGVMPPFIEVGKCSEI